MQRVSEEVVSDAQVRAESVRGHTTKFGLSSGLSFGALAVEPYSDSRTSLGSWA